MTLPLNSFTHLTIHHFKVLSGSWILKLDLLCFSELALKKKNRTDELWIAGMERQKICPNQLLSLLSFCIFSSLFFFPLFFFSFFAILETDGCVKRFRCFSWSFHLARHVTSTHPQECLLRRSSRQNKYTFFYLFIYFYLCNSASVCLRVLPTIPIWNHSHSTITTTNGDLSPRCNATWLLIGRCRASPRR